MSSASRGGQQQDSGITQQHAQHISRMPESGNNSIHHLLSPSMASGELLCEAEELLESGPDWALLVLSKGNPIRRAAAVVATNRYFEWFILALILANCATLAMYSHQPGFDETQLGKALTYTDYVFTACFSLEMLLKVVAMGLVCKPGTYLRDGWNILDGAVVLLGWVDIALSGDDYIFLRTVRVLRPLRTITHIRGLKVPVATLAKALPMLLDVLVLCLFAFFAFGVVAVQLFAGALRNRCAAADFSSAYLVPDAGMQQSYVNVSYLQPPGESGQQCSGYLASDVTWASAAGKPVWSGGSPGGGWTCPTQPQQPSAPFGQFCAVSENPNQGMSSFDTIVWAWVTIFQCLTTEGWVDIMYALQDAVSPWVLVYFLLLIVFGSFFLVNLALAVLYLQFTKEFSVSAASNAASRTLSMQVGKAVSRAGSAAASLADDMLSPRVLTPDSKCHTQRTAGIGQHGTFMNDAVVDQCTTTQQQVHGGPLDKQDKQQQELLVANSSAEHSEGMLLQPQPVMWGNQLSSRPRQAAQCTDDLGQPPGTWQSLPGVSDLPASPKRLPPLPVGGSWKRITGEQLAAASSSGSLPGSTSGSEGSGASAGGAAEQDYVSAKVVVIRRTNSKKATHWASAEATAGQLTAQKAQQRWAELSPRTAELSPRTILKHPVKQPVQPARQAAPLPPSSSLQRRDSCLEGCWQPIADNWEWLRQRCRDLVKSGWVEIVSLVVIITNTAVMASQSYPGTPQWQVISDYLNVGFCLYFTLELLVKLMASSIRMFIKDRMNQFDLLVVAASLVEMVMFLVPGDETTSSSLSVLRTARLLRVFKLARSWAELNRIITTILRSFSQVMYLSLLLLLFMFVFALMGMQLFGFKFASCSVDGAQQLCPPGTPALECPPYPDCYVSCRTDQAFAWINVTDSPYHGMAYCEQFPRNSSHWGNATAAALAAAADANSTFQYWAQVGKAEVPNSRFDNIGWALITVFQIITTENWNDVAYDAMTATSPAAYLWFVTIIVLGNYILLNLFLAILLENFGASTNGGASTANSTGGTLAAAAKAAQLTAWLQDLLQESWFAKMFKSRNRVSAMQDEGDDELVAPRFSSAGGNKQLQASQQVPAVAFQPVAGSSNNAGAAVTRGPAFLQGPASSWDPGNKLLSLTGQRPSIAGGYPMAAPNRRSFSPLLVPSKNSDSLDGLLVSRHGSFLGGPGRTHSVTGLSGRTHSVTGLAPGGLVAKSARSCASAASFATWAFDGNADLYATGQAAAAATQQGNGSQGSVRAHRMASPAETVAEQQQLQSPLRKSDCALSNGQHGLQEPVQRQATELDLPPTNAAQVRRSMEGAASTSSMRQLVPWTARPALFGRSCLVFGPDNRLRRQLHMVLCQPWFEHAILVLIFASSIALALDMPHLDPTGPFKGALEVADCVFAVLFLVEAFLKITVHGVVLNGPGSYLRNPWNCLDFGIVVIGIVVMGTTLSGLHREASLSSLKALRTLRALRPLRIASRLQGMKVVVNSLFASLPALGNVLLVCLLFYLIFGIMAVDLLGGSLYSCQDPRGRPFDAVNVLPAGQHITRVWCLNSSLQVTTSAYHSSINVTVPPYTPQRQWTNPIDNYDNILMATFTLWQISTTELWVDTMHGAIAAVGVDQQPRAGHNPLLALFFIAFIVFGGFFVLQLFVSVTIEKFSEMHQQQGKSALLTPQQEGWLKIERMMADINLQVKRLPPKQRWRAAVFRTVESKQFELAAMAAIVANCIVMALMHADMSPAWEEFMAWSNIGFTAFFTVEIVAEFVAHGYLRVLRDTWCRFDLLVVLVSLAGVAVDLATPTDLQFLPILRVLRVVRIFRLVPKAEGLRVLLRTLFMSLPALGNIVSVLGLFFFIYAVIGMNLWGAVKHAEYLTRQANFQHVGMALLTLFRMITGESWNGIMQDCMVTSMCVEVVKDVSLPAGGSVSSVTAGMWLDSNDALLAQLPAGAVLNRCSPSPVGAVIYFCSFVLLCGLVLVNFVIGVIIDNFASSCQHDDLPVTKENVDHFAQVWSELDPQASCFIQAMQLSTLIQELLPPLGVKGEQDARAKIQGIIMNVDIPVRNGKIHFLETMHALAGRLAGVEVPEDEEEKVRQKLYPRLPSKDAADIPKYGVSHFYAALYVQAAVRGFLKRHELKEGRMSGGGVLHGAQQQQRRSTLGWLQHALGSRPSSAPGSVQLHKQLQQQSGPQQQRSQSHAGG